MGTCHPMATLKYIDSVTSLHVNIKLRNEINGLLSGNTTSHINENDQIMYNYILMQISNRIENRRLSTTKKPESKLWMSYYRI